MSPPWRVSSLEVIFNNFKDFKIVLSSTGVDPNSGAHFRVEEEIKTKPKSSQLSVGLERARHKK
jgi:hypothetical protein